jgi:mono/diheme cytochrome c family protein
MEDSPVMFRYQRALIGVVAAGMLTLPMLSAANAAAKKPAKKPAAKPAAKGGDAKAGQMAFSKEGCTGCHKSKDFPKGGEIGPDLSAIGGEKKAEEISAYIKHPKSGSVMPAFKGPQKTLDDLTAYMMSQK